METVVHYDGRLEIWLHHRTDDDDEFNQTMTLLHKWFVAHEYNLFRFTSGKCTSTLHTHGPVSVQLLSRQFLTSTLLEILYTTTNGHTIIP